MIRRALPFVPWDRPMHPPDSSSASYSLEIPLPPDVDEKLHTWAKRTPGATWPKWGGHITILNRFAVEGELEQVLRKIELVSSSFNPFVIRFDRVVCDRHWLDPDLTAVFLTSSPNDDQGHRVLLDFRDAVCAALAPLKRDIHPETSEEAYVPHLSLTSGLPEPDAARLADAARASGLKVEFTAENISLLEFITGLGGKEQMRRARSFALARPDA